MASQDSTFGSEDGLPRVPLPSVEQSCDRFLEWCAPLLSADELAATETAVAEFRAPGSPAHTLQAALAEHAERPEVHSWLDGFWPYRYLGRRDRIALNANFFFLFNDAGTGTQVERAAGLIASTVDYKRELDAEILPPATQRGQPQTMEQHKFLFSSTRIPGAVQDTVRTPYSENWPGASAERHIVVFFRGNMFSVRVLGEDGTPHTAEEIATALRALQEAGEHPAESAVGHLTTKARAEWAGSRRALVEADPRNAEALDVLERALFCVCLDDVSPQETAGVCRHLLAGDSGNRWFDKAVSFVVFGDGTAGVNIEHCCLDGTTILNFVDSLFERSVTEHERNSGARSQGTPLVTPLDFVLDDRLRSDVDSAAQAFAGFADATATTVVSFSDFGSDDAKKLKVSPDAFVQLAYQLAHRRARGFTGATYESIATRQYHHGRTEAMRVITPEIVDFVSTMDDPGAERDAKLSALHAAADRHVARARECQAIEAPEQHLWELQLVQRRRGDELGVTEELSLFDSPGWTIMRNDYLSTSSAPSQNIRFFGFGSTSTQCIGVAYVLLPGSFHVHLSTPKAVSEQMYAFADALSAAITELRDLLG